jgi:hypothetical protein
VTATRSPPDTLLAPVRLAPPRLPAAGHLRWCRSNAGRSRRTRAAVNQLLDRKLKVVELERPTRSAN